MKTKIKLCGIKSIEDVGIMNENLPDYCGFIIDFPKSHRSLTKEVVRELSNKLDPSIKKVGVFVNSPIEDVMMLLEDDVIQMAQLHGDEDEDYIKELQKKTNKPVMKVIIMRDEFDVFRANESPADFVLLDAGKGSGQAFNWDLLKDMKREYFLAGGLHEGNLKKAVVTLRPYAIDLSSSIETDGRKDPQKVKTIMEIMGDIP
ncbi:MAG: phosphoribosylanthranilate isomerase [Lachnospiraceae bacterium]|nr:phosphoribosylanthranilate isomerase [Lachnospiraceae bacterium]